MVVVNPSLVRLRQYFFSLIKTHSTSVDRPVAVILAGQPGAGKSGVTQRVKDSLDNNVVVVDPDKLRKFHPDYDRLMMENDKTAADITHEECSKWAIKLRDSAIENRRNIILDGTMKDPEKTELLCKLLKEKGYRIEVHAVAVSAEQSLVGILSRYEVQKEEAGAGRWVDENIHNKAYAGMLISLKRVEEYNLADGVCVHNRNGETLYSNFRNSNGAWEKASDATTVVEQERNREWTPEETNELLDDLETTSYKLRNRNAPMDEMKHFLYLEQRVHNKLDEFANENKNNVSLENSQTSQYDL